MTKLNCPRVLVAALAAAAVAAAGAAGATGARAANPSLTLSINLSGGLEVVLGNGTRIRGAGAIPPGPYLLIVNSDVPDDRDIFHVFHISGPGVEVSSDLLPCENPREIYTITLRPSTSYVYVDSRHPELGRITLTTSAAGSSAETSSSAPGHKAGGFSGSVSNQSLVGSKAVAGTLVGDVKAAGGLTLTRNGKPVSLLKQGRYRITVRDATAKRGFALQRDDRAPVTLTRDAYVGKRTVTMTLKPGRWTFFTPSGASQSFSVIA